MWALEGTAGESVNRKTQNKVMAYGETTFI
jgi:hypothetical protein